jgi:hypothetical protein
MLDDQILKLEKRKIDKRWWESLLKEGSDDDRKVVNEFLTKNKISLEKPAVALSIAIKTYLDFPEEERRTTDADVLKAAEKVEKARVLLITVLDLVLKRTPWPATTRLRNKLKQEMDVLTTSEVMFKRVTKGQETLIDREGMELKPRDFSSNISKSDPLYGKAQMALQAWQVTQAEVRKRKKAYLEAKLSAKLVFAAYEQALHQISPDYRAKKVDWEDEGAWEKIQDDHELIDALNKRIARQEGQTSK